MAFEIKLRNPGAGTFNILLSDLISKTYTTYKTFLYNNTTFIINSGQIGVDYGMLSRSVNENTWILGLIQNSSNVYYPFVKQTTWRWISGNSKLN